MTKERIARTLIAVVILLPFFEPQKSLRLTTAECVKNPQKIAALTLSTFPEKYHKVKKKRYTFSYINRMLFTLPTKNTAATPNLLVTYIKKTDSVNYKDNFETEKLKNKNCLWLHSLRKKRKIPNIDM